jgi:dTDP-4-amino-4,6-dideoxygalactose transaminase
VPQAIKSPALALLGGPKAMPEPYMEVWPRISEEEITAVIELLRNGQVSIKDGTGVIGEFERNWAAFIGSRFCLAQNNGTSAIHAGLFGLGVAPGDEVIVPSYTWLASVMPILSLNAVPVFCEVDPHTLVADARDIERKITPQTKAIVVTHLWGNPVDMDAVMAVAQQHHLGVLEDCSHAHGATYKGKRIGGLGDVGAFSLQGSKAMVAGEGGAVLTDDPRIHDRMLVLGHPGRIKDGLIEDEFRGCEAGFGFKYRAHPLAMAIANVQLLRLEETNSQRRRCWEYLAGGLRGMPGVEVPAEYAGAVRGGFYGTRLIYHPEQLDNLPVQTYIAALRAEGLQVDPDGFPLLHLSRIFCERINFAGKGYPFDGPNVKRAAPYGPGTLPVTEELHGRLLMLPTFTLAGTDILDQYLAAFRKVAEQSRCLPCPT